MKKLTTLTAICIAIFSIQLATIQAATIQVSPGTNTIYDAINAAASGDVLIIADGTYNEVNTTIISKALTIKAAEGANPFVNHKRYDINVGDGDDVTIQGLILDNSLQAGTEPVRVNSGTNNNLKFINCTFQNGTSYGIRLYNIAVQVDTFLVSGCIFKNLQHMAIYSVNGGTSPGRFKNAIIENTTFINIVHPSDLTHAIYLRDHDGVEGNDPKVLIDHCTFYNTAPGSYVIYLNRIAGTTISNCIVSNDADKKSNYAFYIYGGSAVSNSIWYNCNSGVRSGAVVTNLSNVDPLFINPALNDFNLDVNSPAVGAATDSKNIGDTRWKVAAAELSISITSPAADQETSDTYRIGFVPLDPSGVATISLLYSTDNENWTLIVDNLASTVMYYDWNVRTFNAGNYYVKAVINDGSETVTDVSAGRVVVVPDVIAPRAPADLSGDFADGKLTLSWTNPTSIVPVATPVNDFESGVGAFVETKSSTGAEGSFQSTTGQTGNGMQVNFDIQTAWTQYGVKTDFTTPVDYVSTIEFWYKGDGSSNKIRIIIEQGNGDWWYNESIVLSSTEWQKATLNASSFGSFSWHVNQKSVFNHMDVTAMNFVVSIGSVATGNFVLDGISFSGNIPPSADFTGTKIVRRTDRYPADYTDGTLIYNGTAETFIDESIEPNTDYYYAAFAYDDLENYSSFTSNAAYFYDGLVSSTFEINNAVQAFSIHPNIIRTSAIIGFNLTQNQLVSVEVFNTTGMKVTDLINQHFSAGSHTVQFNANSFNNGLYIVKLTAGKDVNVKKILINK